MYYGDLTPAAVIDIKFYSHDATGAPISLLGTPVVKCYRDNDTGTEVTTGVTLSVDFDSIVGLNNIRVDTSNAFYTAGSNFALVITAGTIDGVSVVGYVVGQFSISGRLTAAKIWNTLTSTLTTSGSIGKLLVDKIDTVLSTLATASALATVNTTVNAIAGYVDTEVAAIKAKTDQLTFTISNKVDAGIVSAASFIQDAADKIWASATRELTGLGFDVTVGTNNDKVGYSLSTVGVLAIWHQLLSAIVTDGTIGKLLKDNINAAIDSRASQTSVDALDLSDLAAIKAITDQFLFDGDSFVKSSEQGEVIVATNNDKTGYALSAAGIDAILDDAPSAELATIPGITASLRQMIQFLFTYFRNDKVVTATHETLKKDGGGTLGTATLSDDGTTFEKGKMQ